MQIIAQIDKFFDRIGMNGRYFAPMVILFVILFINCWFCKKEKKVWKKMKE